MDTLSYHGQVANRGQPLHNGSITHGGSRPTSSHHSGEGRSLTGSQHRGRQQLDTGSVHSDWSAPPTNHLPPLHEHQVMEGSSHLHHWQQQRRETEGTVMNHQLQHGSHPVLPRGHSPSPPPLPTSLPPPLSSLPQHTRSMDHILNHPDQKPVRTRMGTGPVSQSHTQFHNPQFMQSQPLLPSALDQRRPRPSSPEYAEPKLVAKNYKNKQEQMSSAKPPRPEEFVSSRSRQGPVEELPPQLPAKKTMHPKPVAVPQAPQLLRASSEQPQVTSHPPPLQPYPRAMSVEQEHTQAPHARQPHHGGIKDVLTQWKIQQESQERERQNILPQAAPAGLLDMPSGLIINSGPTSQHSSQSDHWTTTPSPQGFENHIQTSIVKNTPPAFTAPHQNIVPPTSSNLHPPRHHHMPTRSHTRKNTKLEDIYQSDPRKPKRRKGHVPGAVWKQVPKSSRIESSSEDSDSDSADSEAPPDNTSLASEYV